MGLRSRDFQLKTGCRVYASGLMRTHAILEHVLLEKCLLYLHPYGASGEVGGVNTRT